jgi:cell division protein FtsL
MPRILVVVAMALALSSAVFLYAVKYETRTLEAEVQAKERAIEKARQDITVMEAERAHLSSPDRIAPLARNLGMVPLRPDQITAAMPTPSAVDNDGRKPQRAGRKP